MLNLNFENDIKNEVISRLPKELVDVEGLRKLSADDLLVIYFNWQERLIAPRFYKVHISRELSLGLKTIHAEFENAFISIKTKLENGENVHPHLSTGIKTIYQPKSSQKHFKRRRDLDLMLNDWGIHHLHLSNKIEQNGFVTRTPKILFAAFRDNNAYMIDIKTHGGKNLVGGWWDTEIVRIIYDNWPDSNIMVKVNGVSGLSREVSSEDRRELRSAGINVPVQIGSEVFMSSGCLMGAGFGFHAVNKTNIIWRALNNVKNQIIKNPNFIRDIIIQAGRIPPKNLDLHFLFLDYGFGLIENNSKVIIRLSH